MAKVIQLASIETHLFALDDDGRIWTRVGGALNFDWIEVKGPPLPGSIPGGVTPSSVENSGVSGTAPEQRSVKTHTEVPAGRLERLPGDAVGPGDTVEVCLSGKWTPVRVAECLMDGFRWRSLDDRRGGYTPIGAEWRTEAGAVRAEGAEPDARPEAWCAGTAEICTACRQHNGNCECADGFEPIRCPGCDGCKPTAAEAR